jgi:chromosome segregation ATPase
MTSRERASSLIIAAGSKAKNAQMIALATQVRLDGFVKVKKAINEMIADLKQQQEDEVEHKNFCESEFHTNDMDTIAKEGVKKDLETKIATLEESIESLKDEITATKAALEQTKVEMMSASMDRVEQNKAFQASVADQRATQALLEKVQVRLAKFYGEKGVLLQNKVKQHQPVPPVQIVEYKQNGGASPVISMIDGLIHDAAVLEKEAIADESAAQTDYEAFVKESNDSMEAKMRAITNLQETKATAESELEVATTDLAAVNSDLEALAKYAADLHGACDFTLKNFDVRQTARAEEVEALQQALAILSGMQ